MTIIITITSVNIVKTVMYYMRALTFQYTLLRRGCQCSPKKGTLSDCCGLVGAESGCWTFEEQCVDKSEAC